MASIKIKFRPSTKEGCDGIIYYQILHNRIPRQIATDYHIRPAEWDERRSSVVAQGKERETYLMYVRDHIRWDTERLQRVIRKLNRTLMDYTADDIVDEFRSYSRDYSFVSYMESIITRLRQNGKIGTADNYHSALNSFKRFMSSISSEDSYSGEEDVMLDSINTDLMERYEAWHRKQGHISNTISFYIRIFRAVYKRAVDDNIIEDAHPFRRVYTGIDKTPKRALPLETIRKLNKLDLTHKPRLGFARDIFLLSFYLRGMSIIDMCYLRKTDLTDGKVSYRRRKTGQLLTIAWTKEMQHILDKYPQNETDYLLPIITKPDINPKWAYKNISYKVNKSLKELSKMAGASEGERWSLYNARHTWASLARASGIPLNVISEAMGHENERTTQIYLASLDTNAVDKANDLVISLI